MSKFFKIIMCSLIILPCMMALTACGPSDNSSDELSAKQIYVMAQESGYTGTYQEWLDSIKGADGQNGTDGASWLSGTTAPSSSSGKNGDFYLNTTSYDVYKKSNGTWGVVVNIKGADGDKGNDGQNGITPHIGENGNWWIGNTDTGKVATNNQSFTITYTLDPACHLPNGVNNTTTVIYGQNIVLMPIPTNDFGYEFDGWYSTTGSQITTNDGKVTNVTPITREITLKAVFKDYGQDHTTSDGFVYDNFTRLMSYTGSDTTISVPKATTSISPNFGNTTIQNINIYQSALHLLNRDINDSWSFNKLIFTNLKKVNILDNSDYSSDFRIPAEAFEGITTLEEIDYSISLSLTEIGTNAFNNCSSLKSISGGDGWAYIGSSNGIKLGQDIFTNTLITKVQITGNIINNIFNHYAFYYSTQITYINIDGTFELNDSNYIELSIIEGKHWENATTHEIVTSITTAGMYELVND